MNWYKRIQNQCTGNGRWGPCINLVHQKRDEVYRRAEKAAEKMGHKLGKWTAYHINYCRRCGHNVHAHNILAPTDTPDFTGAAISVRCPCHLENERFVSDEQLADINKPAVITVAGNWFRRALIKSAQSGEYWITEDGNAIFADVDVGEYSHEGYVMEQLQREIIEESKFPDFADGEYPDWHGWKQTVAQEKAEEMGIDDIGVAYEQAIRDMKIDNEKLTIAEGQGDARLYAMKNWSWKRLADLNVETWTLTPNDMQVIASGVWDAHGETINDQTMVSIFVHTTGAMHEASLGSLSQGILDESQEPQSPPASAYEQAIQQIDRPSNPYYQRWGD